MTTDTLAGLGAGFSHEAFGSQAVFRAALSALSHPGRIQTLAHDAQVPPPGHAAAAVLLLALLDADTSLWLSPALADGIASRWLRFHTGCRLVADSREADFLWIARGDTLPDPKQLRLGSDNSPEQSATLVVEVDGLHAGGDGPWQLSGPGLREPAALRVDGLTPDFPGWWAHNHAGFPRGVDLFLATDTQLAGLPRTLRIAALAEA